jgi:hypothetical protein
MFERQLVEDDGGIQIDKSKNCRKTDKTLERELWVQDRHKVAWYVSPCFLNWCSVVHVWRADYLLSEIIAKSTKQHLCTETGIYWACKEIFCLLRNSLIHWLVSITLRSSGILYSRLQRVTLPDAVIIQFVLLRMGMLMFETCRGL